MVCAKKVLQGARFQDLTVLAREGHDATGRALFRCRCGCGRECLVRGSDLRSGHTRSCGCLRSRTILQRLGKVQLTKFGSVLVLGEADQEHTPITPRKKWVVVCTQCGHRCFIANTKQIRRRTARCECLKGTYTSWRDMIQRCTNPKHEQYADYGGRGILVCAPWRKSFAAFLEDLGTRPEGKTLDRINNDSGYSKENCRWATAAEQAASRRTRTRP